MKETETIKEEIEQFKTDNGGEYSNYYIGITKHLEQRLVEDNEAIQEHLNKGEYTEGNPTYTAECENRDEAVEIEQYFQSKGMLKYNPRSHGVEESKFIYCYKMTDENIEKVLSGNSEDGKLMSKSIKTFKEFIDKK